jgi:hypothetical protein
VNQIQLLNVLSILFPGSLYPRDYTLAVDGSGNASISMWSGTIGAQPTADQLATELASLQFQQAQAAQIALLGAAYQAAVASAVAYMGTAFMDDPEHQQLLARAVQAYTLAGAVPAGFFVPDVNNAPVAMTLAQLQGLAAAVAAQEWAAFSKWMTLQKDVAAATTIAAVQAIVW